MAENQGMKSVPPLTLDNVFNIVKNVKNWRTLGRHMLLSSFLSSDLDYIQRQHVSDEACLKAVINAFLSGKGRYMQPSWRAIIWSLDQSNEIQLAEHIKAFAEPMQDRYMTVENVSKVMKIVTVAVERRQLMWLKWDLIPHPRLQEIYKKYSTEEQRMHACADFYVNYHPHTSWTRLCRTLYQLNEMSAARKAKTFIPQTDLTLTVENVVGVMKTVTDGRAEEVWLWLIDEYQFESVNRKCSTEIELTHACADIYINCDPESNWEDIASGLYTEEEKDAVEKVRSYLKPRDFTITTERLVEMFSSLDTKYVDFLADSLDTPSSKKAQMNYHNPAQRREAYLDYYVHNHPATSWTNIAKLLHKYGLHEQADMVENTYIQAAAIILSG